MGVLSAVLAIAVVSCKESDEITIEGAWELSSSDYYYDGALLDYHNPHIGICDSAAFKPVLVYHYDVIWSFYKNGTGNYSGNDTVIIGFTYTLKDNLITLSFGDEEDETVYKTSIESTFTFENGKLSVKDIYTGINGWAKEDNRELVFGADGLKNHKLEAVNCYTKILKE